MANGYGDSLGGYKPVVTLVTVMGVNPVKTECQMLRTVPAARLAL